MVSGNNSERLSCAGSWILGAIATAQEWGERMGRTPWNTCAGLHHNRSDPTKQYYDRYLETRRRVMSSFLLTIPLHRHCHATHRDRQTKSASAVKRLEAWSGPQSDRYRPNWVRLLNVGRHPTNLEQDILISRDSLLAFAARSWDRQARRPAW